MGNAEYFFKGKKVDYKAVRAIPGENLEVTLELGEIKKSRKLPQNPGPYDYDYTFTTKLKISKQGGHTAELIQEGNYMKGSWNLEPLFASLEEFSVWYVGKEDWIKEVPTRAAKGLVHRLQAMVEEDFCEPNSGSLRVEFVKYFL